MTLQNEKKGVTLIELLIVVLILAALAMIAIPRISQSADRAKQEACARNIDIINSAIEQYNVENSGYPQNLKKVTKNPDYFPDGEPVCPITQKPYPNNLKENRVDATKHGKKKH